jgi:hypothetical protein
MIVVQLTGGLGNQMFQYSFGRYLAKKNNTRLFLDTSVLLNRVECGLTFYNYELGIFNIEATLASSTKIPVYPSNYSVKNILFRGIHLLKVFSKGLKYVREKQFHFNPSYLELNDNSYLDGYWQTEKYFKEISPTIKKDFQFNFELSQKCIEISKKIILENSVCIHIRRGDYIKLVNFHGMVGNDYVRDGIKIINEKISNPHFFVFSNDIQWCKENLVIEGKHTFIEEINAGNNNNEHFKLMTLCKHFIIANSTFSWWAAWLSDNMDKIVIAPKKWVALNNINTNDIIPEEWIKL